jgi:hypothetical protein
VRPATEPRQPAEGQFSYQLSSLSAFQLVSSFLRIRIQDHGIQCFFYP